jgi:hypothetical protein
MPRLDLGKQASVVEFAEHVVRSGLPISVLVNNAGKLSAGKLSVPWCRCRWESFKFY